MAGKTPKLVLIGTLAMGLGLVWPQVLRAEGDCIALQRLSVFVTKPPPPGVAPNARVLADLRGAVDQAVGAGQISGAEASAFQSYLTRLAANDLFVRQPIGPAELLRRHTQCVSDRAPKADAPRADLTSGQTTARHALPQNLPQNRPSRSQSPEIDDPDTQGSRAALLAQLRFLLAVVLSGLLAWLVWTRLARLREIRRRQARRHICCLPTVFTVAGLSHLGFVVDLSALGCKLETRGVELAKGEGVGLLLPGRRIEAQVVWTTRTHAGLAFEHSLAKDQLRALLKQRPPHVPQVAQTA